MKSSVYISVFCIYHGVCLILDYVAVVMLATLALAMTVWYFRKRRELITLIRDIARELEEVLRPTDKVYELLGYLVGFKARFKLGRSVATDAYVTLTTVPIHSLLYYPIAKLMSRKSMLGMALEFRKEVPREVHLILYGRALGRYEEALKRDIPYINQLRTTRVSLPGGEYKVYYEDQRDAEVVFKELSRYGLKPIQFSIFKSRKLIYVLAEAKRGVATNTYKFINSVYKELSDTQT